MNLKPLEEQIRLARKALAEAQRIEEANDFDDAILSMERSYCEGSLESLEHVYILLNGHGYDE